MTNESELDNLESAHQYRYPNSYASLTYLRLFNWSYRPDRGKQDPPNKQCRENPNDLKRIK